MKNIIYLKEKLIGYGHTNEFFLGFQVALVIAGYRGIDLHDDTCKIITSKEYLQLYK